MALGNKTSSLGLTIKSLTIKKSDSGVRTYPHSNPSPTERKLISYRIKRGYLTFQGLGLLIFTNPPSRAAMGITRITYLTHWTGPQQPGRAQQASRVSRLSLPSKGSPCLSQLPPRHMQLELQVWANPSLPASLSQKLIICWFCDLQWLNLL